MLRENRAAVYKGRETQVLCWKRFMKKSRNHLDVSRLLTYTYSNDDDRSSGPQESKLNRETTSGRRRAGNAERAGKSHQCPSTRRPILGTPTGARAERNRPNENAPTIRGRRTTTYGWVAPLVECTGRSEVVPMRSVASSYTEPPNNRPTGEPTPVGLDHEGSTHHGKG